VSTDATRTPNLVWIPFVAVALLAGLALIVYNTGSAAATANAEEDITAVWMEINGEPAKLCAGATREFWGENAPETDIDLAEMRERCRISTEEFFGEDGLGVRSVDVLEIESGLDRENDSPLAFVAVEVDSKKLVEGSGMDAIFLAVPMREVDGKWVPAGPMFPFATKEDIRAALNLSEPAPSPES
jgi:hypothetical protein